MSALTDIMNKGKENLETKAEEHVVSDAGKSVVHDVVDQGESMVKHSGLVPDVEQIARVMLGNKDADKITHFAEKFHMQPDAKDSASHEHEESIRDLAGLGRSKFVTQAEYAASHPHEAVDHEVESSKHRMDEFEHEM